jgi:hypothetical protein
MILAIFFIVIFIYMTFRTSSKGSGTMLAITIGTIGLVILFLCPILLAAALPGAFRQAEFDSTGTYKELDHPAPSNAFFGNYADTATQNNMNWGGDVGWILAFVSCIFLFIAIILYTIETMPRAAPPPFPQPRPQMPGPYPGRYGQPAPAPTTQPVRAQPPVQPSPPASRYPPQPFSGRQPPPSYPQAPQPYRQTQPPYPRPRPSSYRQLPPSQPQAQPSYQRPPPPEAPTSPPTSQEQFRRHPSYVRRRRPPPPPPPTGSSYQRPERPA